jgi:hypothetical protein
MLFERGHKNGFDSH